jgi:NAD(P)H-flavin reductase
VNAEDTGDALPRRFRVELIARSDLSPRVQTFRFRAREPLVWAAEQHLELISPGDGITRFAYSIASRHDPRFEGEFELALARGSTAEILDEIEVGTELEAEGPLGAFTWQARSGGGSVLIGVGTGVAPLRAMIQEEIERGGAARLVLLCGYRSEADVLWERELRSLATQHRRFAFEPTLSRAGRSWNGRRGRVQDHLGEVVPPLGSDLSFYVCGQTAMVADVTYRLREIHGIGADRIRGQGY